MSFTTSNTPQEVDILWKLDLFNNRVQEKEHLHRRPDNKSKIEISKWKASITLPLCKMWIPTKKIDFYGNTVGLQASTCSTSQTWCMLEKLNRTIVKQWLSKSLDCLWVNLPPIISDLNCIISDWAFVLRDQAYSSYLYIYNCPSFSGSFKSNVYQILHVAYIIFRGIM